MRYRRVRAKGATYFFTVNLADRSSDLLVRRIDWLRTCMAAVKQRHPFDTVAWVVMPDHLHMLWRLPDDDDNYSMRWSLIKSSFSRRIEAGEDRRASRVSKRERGLWQRRFWEHQIRDDRDLKSHIDYIHYNPVKHGHVVRPIDWPHSSLHAYVERGWLAADWAAEPEKGALPADGD